MKTILSTLLLILTLAGQAQRTATLKVPGGSGGSATVDSSVYQTKNASKKQADSLMQAAQGAFQQKGDYVTVNGDGYSEVNFTAALELKLQGIQSGATRYNRDSVAQYIAENALETDLRSYHIRGLEALGKKFVAESFSGTYSMATAAVSMTDGRIDLKYTYIERKDTLPGLTFQVMTAGDFTGDNNNKVGLYKYDPATKVATLVASSASGDGAWKTAGAVDLPFTAPYVAEPGPYYVAFLYNNSSQVTAPQLLATSNSGTVGNSPGFGTGVKLYCFTTGTDLPATIDITATSSVGTRFWFGLYK